MMTIQERNSRAIVMEDLTDLEMLSEYVIYSGEFEELPKERQQEMYHYCKIHANREVCRENLTQMRYAVAKIYFGE